MFVDWIIVACIAACLLFALLYALTSRWEAHVMGWHMMSSALVLAAALLFGVGTGSVGPNLSGNQAVRAIVFALLFAELLWRSALVIHSRIDLGRPDHGIVGQETSREDSRAGSAADLPLG